MPTPDSARPRGILKSSSSNTGRRAVWNESNLDQNEVIKAELNTTKIDEPKTPYHGPLQDEDDEMEPLDLGASASKAVEALAPAPAAPKAPAPPGQRKRVTLSGEDTETIPSEAKDNVERCSIESFTDHRKEHYNMREAMQRGKELCHEVVDGDEQA